MYNLQIHRDRYGKSPLFKTGLKCKTIFKLNNKHKKEHDSMVLDPAKQKQMSKTQAATKHIFIGKLRKLPRR